MLDRIRSSVRLRARKRGLQGRVVMAQAVQEQQSPRFGRRHDEQQTAKSRYQNHSRALPHAVPSVAGARWSETPSTLR